MRLHEILWMAGIAAALIGACAADSESWIPPIIILAGCGITAIGFFIRRKGIGTDQN